MNKDMLKRLARLEAKLGISDANTVDTNRARFRTAMMAIVAFHVGKFSGGESQATAFARALDMTNGELKRALTPGHDGPNFWPLMLERLNTLIALRGGRAISQNGFLVAEEPSQDDDRRDGFDVLDELYQEIPEDIKTRWKLLPSIVDHIPAEPRTDQDNPTQR
jgi:hypothetical protein